MALLKNRLEYREKNNDFYVIILIIILSIIIASLAGLSEGLSHDTKKHEIKYIDRDGATYIIEDGKEVGTI